MNTNLLLKTLELYNPKNNKKRFGHRGDGGYVIIDGYDYDHYFVCGVGNDVSFEVDFFGNVSSLFGTAFDGTIAHIPTFPKNINFIHKNISPQNTNKTTNLEEEIEPHQNTFVKMDIEGHEIKWINHFKYMNKIKQLVIEIHGLFDLDGWTTLANYEYHELESAMLKLNETHYLVHFHSNNNAEYKTINEKQFPTVAELTFIRKKDSEVCGFNKTTLPINGLDFKNGNGNREDLIFNSYPFVQ